MSACCCGSAGAGRDSELVGGRGATRAAAPPAAVAAPPNLRLRLCTEAPVRLPGPPGAEQSRGCVVTFVQRLSDPATIRALGVTAFVSNKLLSGDRVLPVSGPSRRRGRRDPWDPWVTRPQGREDCSALRLRDDVHPSVVRPQDLVDDIEPETEAVVRSHRGFLATVEGIEEVLQLGGIDDRAPVMNSDSDVILVAPDRQLNWALGLSVAEGVLDEVDDDLDRTVRIAFRHEIPAHFALERPIRVSRTDIVDRRLGELSKIHRLQPDRHPLSSAAVREIEEL